MKHKNVRLTFELVFTFIALGLAWAMAKYTDDYTFKVLIAYFVLETKFKCNR